jgi:hypothetical protein
MNKMQVLPAPRESLAAALEAIASVTLEGSRVIEAAAAFIDDSSPETRRVLAAEVAKWRAFLLQSIQTPPAPPASKTCVVRNDEGLACGLPARWRVMYHFTNAESPDERGNLVAASTHGVCDNCRQSVRVEDLLSDREWEQIVAHFSELGLPALDRRQTALSFNPIPQES